MIFRRLTCEWCSQRLRPVGRGRRPRFCSVACRAASARYRGGTTAKPSSFGKPYSERQAARDGRPVHDRTGERHDG